MSRVYQGEVCREGMQLDLGHMGLGATQGWDQPGFEHQALHFLPV